MSAVRPARFTLYPVVTLVLAATACTAAGPRPGGVEAARTRGARAAHERPAEGSDARTRRWALAGASALETPTPVRAPYEESVVFDARWPAALGYRLRLSRGDPFRVEVSGFSAEDVLLDLYEVILPSTGQLVLTARAEGGEPRLRVSVPRTGDYILRVQPRPGRAGRARIRIGDGRPARHGGLLFPVAGRTASAIRSRFGAPRDGGRRRHHGVDIFAPRGTPVLAARPGRAVEVRRTGIGGRVIWLRTDDPDLWLYYAHLDEQLVRRGQRVAIGDTIGRVGNTGNARTTPPHLHFGVYLLGDVPVDPEPYLDRPVLVAADADPALLGRPARTLDRATLRVAPDRNSHPTRALSPDSELQVIGGTRGFYRVRLPDGDTGFIAVDRIGRAGREASAAGPGSE